MVETRVNTATHCRYCGTALTRDEKRNCMVCLVCHPPSAVKPSPPKKKNLVGVVPDEKRVREIIKEMVPVLVQDAMEDWYIPRPSVTKSEATDLTGTESYNEKGEITSSVVLLDPDKVITLKVKDWRSQAKELGISLFHRKKADVLKEIEAKKAG